MPTPHGAIEPGKGSIGEGLLAIQAAFRAVVISQTPALVAIELPGRWVHRGASSRRSVELMAMARGMMLSARAEAVIPVMQIEFQEARRAPGLGPTAAGKRD